MPLTKIPCKRFTAFEEITVDLSPGVNVLVGANGTGKTHLMKVAYAACDVSKTKLDFAEKLIRVFLPSGRALGRLVKRQNKSSRATVEVIQHSIDSFPSANGRRRIRTEPKLRATFTNHSTKPESAKVFGASDWQSREIESVYIPVKEMLSNAPGFRSLYTQREIQFEEIYSDILDRAYRPSLRGPSSKDRKRLMESLQQIIDGKVIIKEEEFFLKSKQGNFEFTLLAEGMRKLGLL